MTANVETMMYFGDRPWHGIGTEVMQAATSSEAIVSAGLDWEVGLSPVYAAAPDGSTVPVPGHFATVRQDNNRVLGIVQGRYRPAQNRDCFDFFDSVVGSNAAMFHTAGSLDEGRKVWMLAKLPDDIRVNGVDIVEKFLLLANSHDGSGTLRMLFTPTRVVCQNTLRLALRQGKDDGISIRHTASLDDKVNEAKRALGFAVAFYKEFEVKAQWLADTRFTDLQMDLALSKVFPAKDDDKVSTRTANIREQVKSNFESGTGIDSSNRGTAWAAVNAFTQYTSHQKGVRNETVDKRLDSVWFGSGAALSALSFSTVCEIAAQQ